MNKKVLVLTVSPWRADNNVGNSLNNIFADMDSDIEFANINLKSGVPDNDICSRYFQITEKSLIKGFLKHKSSGAEIKKDNCYDSSESEQKAFDFARTKRWKILFMIRELIWKVCKWKTKELDKFIQSFNPDIIFLSINNTIYSLKIAQYVKNKANKPMIGYIWDDMYGIEKIEAGVHISLYDRVKQRVMKKTIEQCEILYTITDRQKEKYSEYFGSECRVLTKGDKFDDMPEYIPSGDSIKLVYTGNIGDGRWKTLISLGKAIDEINKTISKKFDLDIYTLTPLGDEMATAFDSLDGTHMLGGVSNEKVNEVQSKADILVHIEPFDKMNRLICRQSFSTKLVDYFKKSKTILAIGPEDLSSIEYLIKNDGAIVVTDTLQIGNALTKLATTDGILTEYAQKAWECGKRNHKINTIQKMLRDDFDRVMCVSGEVIKH